MNRITLSGLLGGLLVAMRSRRHRRQQHHLALPGNTVAPTSRPVLPASITVSAPAKIVVVATSPASTAALVSPSSISTPVAAPALAEHPTASPAANAPTPGIILSPRPTGVSITPAVETLPTDTSSSMPIAGAGQVIGQSVQGRDITAHRVGNGPLKVVLVGNIHGAFEANTHVLVQQLLAHFQAHPGTGTPATSVCGSSRP